MENTSFFLGLELGGFLERVGEGDVGDMLEGCFVAFGMFLSDALKQDVPFLTKLLRDSSY